MNQATLIPASTAACPSAVDTPRAADPGASATRGPRTDRRPPVLAGSVGSSSAAMPGVILADTPKRETSSAMSFNCIVRSGGYSLAAPSAA
ncbi:hypothetical protein AB0F15_35345 [Amycolatopsis sp. NPDC026612]|uniref:hypothetical protein n=1 Tax=Amycolatopsis sp. NPDC026612 TaxID=3155466 RepID=UPI0033D38949